MKCLLLWTFYCYSTGLILFIHYFRHTVLVLTCLPLTLLWGHPIHKYGHTEEAPSTESASGLLSLLWLSVHRTREREANGNIQSPLLFVFMNFNQDIFKQSDCLALCHKVLYLQTDVSAFFCLNGWPWERKKTFHIILQAIICGISTES